MKNILVTGSHRSGTTWVGKILASAPHTHYVHEPFHPSSPPGIPFDREIYSYLYLCDENAREFEPDISRLFSGKYPLCRGLIRGSLRDRFFQIKRAIKLAAARRSEDELIIKDPFGLFSSEFFSKTFETKCLILIRHPAAFIASCLRMDWGCDLSQMFSNQPLLMQRHFASFADEFREVSSLDQSERKNLLAANISMWNALHLAINSLQNEWKNDPSWVFVRHEDLARNPIDQFKQIFEKFHLQFTEDSEAFILSCSEGPDIKPPKGEQHVLKRDSAKSITQWKSSLDQEEIDLIKESTRHVWQYYYGEEDW